MPHLPYQMKHIFLFLFLSVPLAYADLRVSFYGSTCPEAESIVREVVRKRFTSDHSITAALLRLHFHDCFATGCDASILIDSTKNTPSEKEAGPNLTVRGYDIIEEAKAEVEAECPSTVSCADIEALATRDAVALSGGLTYAVPTGRRDSLVSNPNNVSLPGPTALVSEVTQMFASKGFSRKEMVTLFGAHTVGVAHCGFFRDRLFDFQGTGRADPAMELGLRRKLVRLCGRGGGATTMTKEPKAFLDQKTGMKIDNQFYGQILAGKGVLEIDQELALDNSTSRFVAGLAKDGALFQRRFADVMVKLGKVDVLVGNAGEIRRKCNSFNRH